MLVLDFETRSRVDLKTAGTYIYVSDPSTQIICLCYTDMATEGPRASGTWYPGDPMPVDLIYFLQNADYVAAHYAEFDMGIYEYIAVEEYGFPEIPHDRWYCTAAQCRVNNLPGGLDEAAWALGLSNRKHPVGGDLIKKLSIPQKDGTFNYDPKLIKDMGKYCAQDVAVTVDVIKHTRSMTEREWQDWYANTLINERGVRVDTELATLALQYAKEEQDEIAVEFKRLTAGVVERHTQNIRIKSWILSLVPEDSPIIDLMTVYKSGKNKLSLDKAIRGQILGAYDANELDVPEDIIYAIELLDDGSKSSVAKFKRMLERADPEDGRVRGAFVFAGASQTLRYASRGLQLHNMRRECWGEIVAANLKACMRNRVDIADAFDTSVMEVLAKALRPAVIPAEGKVFVVGDWSSIEAMVLPWLSDSDGGEAILDIPRQGGDIYTEAAKRLKLTDMDNWRQVTKVTELAAQFGGGYRAVLTMARSFGLSFTESFAQRLVDRWRAANPWCVRYWRDLDRAARAAVCLGGKRFSAGMVDYYFDRKLMGGTLMCIMPGEHIIQYPQTRIEQVTAPWGEKILSLTCMKSSYSPKADQKAWPRAALYGGLMAENATQAFAACILRNANRQLDDVVAHIHDEIVQEVLIEDAEKAKDMLRSVMVTIPEWAEGLPLKAEPVIMTRYGKAA